MRVLTYNRASETALLFSLRRHIFRFGKSLTLRKLVNACLALVEMALKREELTSKPIHLRIEVSPLCNLHCVGCLIGRTPKEGPIQHATRLMSLATFEASVQDLLPYIIKANLYDEGEPLLNKKLPKMVECLHKNRIITCISTNFSLPVSDAFLIDLLKAGLDHMIVAVDGATQETYRLYRKGGNLSLVLSNLRRLQHFKQTYGHLLTEVQFLEFPHNRHEADAVRAIAEELGAERFTIQKNSNPEGWEASRFKGSEAERRSDGCYSLWLTTTINAAGEVGCCDYGEDHGFPSIGSASRYAADGLRNHPRLRELRRSFRWRLTSTLDPVCRVCSMTLRTTHASSSRRG